jgi:hypothetical protein
MLQNMPQAWPQGMAQSMPQRMVRAWLAAGLRPGQASPACAREKAGGAPGRQSARADLLERNVVVETAIVRRRRRGAFVLGGPGRGTAWRLIAPAEATTAAATT